MDRRFLCDFVDDCADNSDEDDPAVCNQALMTDFEGGNFNRWKVPVETAKNSWKIVFANKFRSLRKGPTYDHTQKYRSGSFLYVKTDPRIQKGPEIPQIISPPLKATWDKYKYYIKCALSFHMFKSSPNFNLKVLLHNLETNEKHEIYDRLYSLSGKANQQWQRHSLEIGTEGLYQLEFRAVMDSISSDVEDGKGNAPFWADPYIAIDDMSFSERCVLQPDSIFEEISARNATVKQTEN